MKSYRMGIGQAVVWGSTVIAIAGFVLWILVEIGLVQFVSER